MPHPQERPEARTAVLIFHGMGQQVPYETVADLAYRVAERWPEAGARRKFVIDAVPLRDGTPGPKDGTMARVRLETGEGGADDAKAVDFYESYWAPITEGKVGLFDSLSFLLSAGFKGILQSRKGSFDRVFWRSSRRFNLNAMAIAVQLAVAAALIAAVSVLGASLLFLLISHVFQHLGLALLDGASNPEVRDWSLISRMFDRDLFRILQGELLFFLRCAIFLLAVPATPLLFRWCNRGGGIAVLSAAGIAFLVYHVASALVVLWGLGLGESASRFFQAAGLKRNQAGICLILILFQGFIFLYSALRAGKPWRSNVLNRFIWGNLFLFTVIAIGMGLAELVSIWSHWGARDPFSWEGFFSEAAMAERSAAAPGETFAWLSRLLLVLYGAGGLAALLAVRHFLIQYAGDVAAYVNSHKVSKFSEIRRSIQEDAFKAAHHVYASGYDRIILVAHSLGSLIAYDTYNRIVTESALFHPEWNPVGRTKLFLTFGSPLNKIAFIFRSQVRENGVRELLASAKQPLLEENHAYRPEMWVNVWSRNDIISGPLHLFDHGEVRPDDQSGWPAAADFSYIESEPERIFPDSDFSGSVELRSGGMESRCRPVIPLIDPGAYLPVVAHTQYWKNRLIYDVIAAALRDRPLTVKRDRDRRGSPMETPIG
jgi:hypothetical protein